MVAMQIVVAIASIMIVIIHLVEADPRNTWEKIFDITTVRRGSFRLPYNDKVYGWARREKKRISQYPGSGNRFNLWT